MEELVINLCSTDWECLLQYVLGKWTWTTQHHDFFIWWAA